MFFFNIGWPHPCYTWSHVDPQVQTYLERKEDNVYAIKNFLVMHDSNKKYRTTTNVYYIKFINSNHIVEIYEEGFPRQLFNFKSFEEVASIAMTICYLVMCLFHYFLIHAYSIDNLKIHIFINSTFWYIYIIGMHLYM